MTEDLIKYIPKMLMSEDLDNKLLVLPPYDESIRNKSVTERLVALQDLYNIFIPNKMSTEIYCKLYLSLLRSLQKKQSIAAVRQFNENSKLIRQKSCESIIGGSDSFTVVGPSGIGKSSSVSRAVNILTDTPVLQLTYTSLIPCLQVQTPADCSTKGLLLEILRKTDEYLQTSYHASAGMKGRATIDMLIGSVSQVALNHIGLLIVDEIQNVLNNKNGKNIIGTLIQLINNSGISICMVGTPESTIFFEKEMILARRSLGLSYSEMEYGHEFRKFCNILLQYCFVQAPPIVDEPLLMWLYQHSAGNASIVVSLIHDAQEIAIMDGSEKLDVSSLSSAYERRLKMIHDFISPKIIKRNTPNSQKHNLPQIKNKYTPDGINILQISKKAKACERDIVSELKKNGIQILEVYL